ncbi:MAG: MinD/ParA family protein, partial [Micrococcales bacterium]
MAIWDKEPDGEDLFAPRPAQPEAPIQHQSLAELAVDSGIIDITPSTQSVEIVTDTIANKIVSPTTEVSSDNQPRRSNYSRRDSLRGESFDQPEPAAMLTADRLIDTSSRFRPAPEGAFRKFVYYLTLKTLNLGDSLKVRERKALDVRISSNLGGGAKFVPVLTRKGGVGKTTVTTLLGMALALTREDRIVAIDANPDRGTLAERISKSTRFTVRDVVNRAAAIDGFTDFSTMVSRDITRLDVLASDSDPMLSEAFNEGDYNVVADMAARYYSVVLTDCGTGIVHS